MKCTESMETLKLHLCCYVVLLVFDLQNALRWFAVDCQAAGMAVSALLVFYKEMVDYRLQVGVSCCTKQRSLTILGSCSHEMGEMEQDLNSSVSSNAGVKPEGCSEEEVEVEHKALYSPVGLPSSCHLWS